MPMILIPSAIHQNSDPCSLPELSVPARCGGNHQQSDHRSSESDLNPSLIRDATLGSRGGKLPDRGEAAILYHDDDRLFGVERGAYCRASKSVSPEPAEPHALAVGWGLTASSVGRRDVNKKPCALSRRGEMKRKTEASLIPRS